MANRQRFSRAVQREIARRAVNAIGIPACELCGATGVPLQLHHKDMDAMQTAEKKKRKLTAADGLFVCSPCHDPITAEQKAVLAKVEAVEARHWLPRKPSAFPSRPFSVPAPKDRSVTKAIPRRPIYTEA